MIYKGNNQFSDLSLLERFGQKVETIPFSSCHWWVACLDTYGYGSFQIDGKTRLAHRVAYQLYVGPIPEGMQVLHACDNRACVNPAHFFLGTNQDNIDDKVRKGRQSFGKGMLNGNSKLIDEDVRRIRFPTPRS